MVWKLGKFQSVYNELRYYVESASPCTNLLKFCRLIFQQYGRVIQATLLVDCFIMLKIHCLHRAQVCINLNKNIEQRRWLSFQTISRLTMSHISLRKRTRPLCGFERTSSNLLLLTFYGIYKIRWNTPKILFSKQYILSKF